MRKSKVHRQTNETDVLIELNLDKAQKPQISTTIPFLDHMLDLFAAHCAITLKVKAAGDTEIDDHHLVEDIGISLGKALKEAIGDKKGIYRYGNFLLPMDEALCYIALDLSGRFFLDYQAKIKFQRDGFNYDLVQEFFYALASNALMTLHIKMIKGRNNHHISESMFKGFGRALRQAIAMSKNKNIPSTKGVL
jgi:imidazoleglycerol-phosphate dehydratase